MPISSRSSRNEKLEVGIDYMHWNPVARACRPGGGLAMDFVLVAGPLEIPTDMPSFGTCAVKLTESVASAASCRFSTLP